MKGFWNDKCRISIYRFYEIQFIRALKYLGGSGTNEVINVKVAEIVGIPSEQLEVLHNPQKGGMTEIEYRMMWTRTYLKFYGIIENSTRGVWAFTEKGFKIENVNEKRNCYVLYVH